jgi:hypothetical protein
LLVWSFVAPVVSIALDKPISNKRLCGQHGALSLYLSKSSWLFLAQSCTCQPGNQSNNQLLSGHRGSIALQTSSNLSHTFRQVWLSPAALLLLA